MNLTNVNVIITALDLQDIWGHLLNQGNWLLAYFKRIFGFKLHKTTAPRNK